MLSLKRLWIQEDGYTHSRKKTSEHFHQMKFLQPELYSQILSNCTIIWSTGNIFTKWSFHNLNCIVKFCLTATAFSNCTIFEVLFFWNQSTPPKLKESNVCAECTKSLLETLKAYCGDEAQFCVGDCPYFQCSIRLFFPSHHLSLLPICEVSPVG